jgi:hypothetical protein
MIRASLHEDYIMGGDVAALSILEEMPVSRDDDIKLVLLIQGRVQAEFHSAVAKRIVEAHRSRIVG